ncbi:U4/U6-U5 snRNP complex subunit prp31, partial [Spiromyces aspiralis]
SVGKKLREELNSRVEKLREALPIKAIKALPVPKDPQKKRRGGRRFRKLKEANATTELMKLKNRVRFGVEEQDEILDMEETEGLGMITNQKGRIRAVTNDPSRKPTLSKKYQKILHQTTPGTQTSGLATSLAFTPIQGFELANPQSLAARQQKVKEANERYFGTATPFLNAKRKK